MKLNIKILPILGLVISTHAIASRSDLSIEGSVWHIKVVNKSPYVMNFDRDRVNNQECVYLDYLQSYRNVKPDGEVLTAGETSSISITVPEDYTPKLGDDSSCYFNPSRLNLYFNYFSDGGAILSILSPHSPNINAGRSISVLPWNAKLVNNQLQSSYFGPHKSILNLPLDSYGNDDIYVDLEFHMTIDTKEVTEQVEADEKRGVTISSKQSTYTLSNVKVWLTITKACNQKSCQHLNGVRTETIEQ